MNPDEITDIVEWQDGNNPLSAAPSQIKNYKLTGTTTTIPNTELDLRPSGKGKSVFSDFLCSMKKGPDCVCVKEIRLEWFPHVELNHVSFMDVKINNTFNTRARSHRSTEFFFGIFPIHVHWSISVSSPRWISVSKYICNSPWSYVVTAKNMPQEELSNAGELRVSYTIEKGHRSKESLYVAPKVTLDTAPFPYMIPFYKFIAPGGLSESNISSIHKVINYMEKALIMTGINSTITKSTIWGLSNTINADMQSTLLRTTSEDKTEARSLIEQVILQVSEMKNPGYPSLDSIEKASGNSINRIVSREIGGLGDDIVSCSRRYSN